MAANATTLTLFCLVSGELKSNAFPVEILSNKSIGALKDAIKAKQTPAFDHITASDLVLWHATIDENTADESIPTLNGLDHKTKLVNPRTSLFKLFPETPDDNTYILIERPKDDLHPEVAALRKQLSDMKQLQEDQPFSCCQA